MRARNPSYDRPVAVTRGHIGALRSGSSGINVTDDVGNAVDAVTDVQLSGLIVGDLGDGAALITVSSDITVVGTVSGDGSPFTVSSGTSYRAFPGAAWLDNPTATEHTIGNRFLIVYRDGTDHLTAGNIKGLIATVTATNPWTYTLGSPFTIEDVTNDLRPQGESLSVLDIGGGDYRAVIWACEYNGSVNLSPHFLICDTASASMTSGSTWTRYNVAGALSGHTQDIANGRLHYLSNGTYMAAAQYYVGTTQHAVVISSPTITDWSAPTLVEIGTGYNEVDFEEVSPGTLIAHVRDTAQTFHFTSTSTDFGATWSTPVSLFAAGGYPCWRVLTSGIGLTAYRSLAAGNHTAYRQTQTGVTDTGWGAETILDSTGGANEYATILQLDDNHALVIYAYESSSTDCDIFSEVFTDTSLIGTFTPGTVAISAGDATADYLVDKLVAGAGITTTKLNAGAYETLEIASVFGGAAADVTVADAGGYFVATNVETVLQELGAKRYAGEILISDTPAGSPLVFSDLLQNEAGTDLLYADP